MKTSELSDHPSFAAVFNRRWGASLAPAEARHHPHLYFGIKHYGADPAQFDGLVSSIRLRFNGRWGNYVFQLTNIFHVAEKIGCQRVFVHSTDIFPRTTATVLHGITVDSVRNDAAVEGFQLEGVFFDTTGLGELVADLTPGRRRALALKYVKPLMAGATQARDGLVEPGDLVYHIRSGDIFQGPEGQGGSQLGGALYVQPPLAFYTMIAEAMRHRGSGRALIVSENSLNPTIFPLVQALERAGYAVSMRLQQSLESDLAYLLAARHAVFANGTIGIAVALLSDKLSDGYFFRRDGTGTPFDVDYFLGDHIAKHFIFDEEGAFIQKGEWRNTQQQRDAMVSLPGERLYWERKPKLVNIALGKPTRQSSLSIYSRPDESGRAVDGVRDEDFSFHTGLEHFPWWEVDLGALHRIDVINVFNRQAVPERAYNMLVYVLGEDRQWTRVHDQAGRPFGALGQPERVVLDGIAGRAIRIVLPDYQYLHLQEVEVCSWQRD